MAGLSTVSRAQEGPALDTLTTFQKPRSIRRLIVNNAKGILLFESKGIIFVNYGGMTRNSGNRELHGNVTLAKSRSRAGSINLAVRVNLVVSAVAVRILLSSVFRIPRLHDY